MPNLSILQIICIFQYNKPTEEKEFKEEGQGNNLNTNLD